MQSAKTRYEWSWSKSSLKSRETSRIYTAVRAELSHMIEPFGRVFVLENILF